MANVATLSWQDGDSMRMADLPHGAPATVGRRADADIVIQNDTVSRLHFILRPGGTGFSIENLSQSTDTRVGGESTLGPKSLKDGDFIQAGDVSFHFHDMARAPGRQEVACSHCSRSNGLIRRECWYCGTSMVNALTAGFKVARPVVRLVGLHGSVTLFAGECAITGESGLLEAVNAGPDTLSIIEASGTDWILGAAAAHNEVRLAGLASAPGDRVRHADALELNGTHHLVLLRT